jgi:integrase
MSAKVKWRQGAWWVVTHYSGKRTVRRVGSTKAKRAEAEAIARKINGALALGTFTPKREEKGSPLLFRDFVARYVAEDMAHLAPTTRRDRELHLRAADEEKDQPAGALMRYFGDWRLDAITAPALRTWWNQEILDRGLTLSTGRGYLTSLAGILGYAHDLGLIEANPLPIFRGQLRRRTRTKGARAAAEGGSKIHPVDSPDAMRRLVEAAWAAAEADRSQLFAFQKGKPTDHRRTLEDRTGGLRAYVAVLAMIDAGLRPGEVAGLTWGQVRWGRDEDDTSRALVIDRSRPRGGAEAPPKSGRQRVVALSRRLRTALADLYLSQFQPGPDARVLPGFDPSNFAVRDWRRILKRAELEHRPPKDLRDTYASWLLSLGVQLGYVSAQLGHATVAVTASHYARWCAGDVYREPMALLAGEVPADLLARVIADAPKAVPSGTGRQYTAPPSGEDQVRESPDAASMRRGFAILERETGLEPATLSLGS